MNEHDIVFLLDTSEKVIVSLEEYLEYIDCCYRADIILLQKNEKILLSNDSLYYSIKRFNDFLQKALLNKLSLDESLTNDIGYLCNEYYQDKTGFVIEELVGGPAWVGYKYHLWEAYANGMRFMTWLYNEEGIIIFEVTPCYPYLYCEPEEEPNYIFYEEWIKTYKPYFIKKISVETAKKWLEQSEYIVEAIENNIEKWKKTT